MKIELRGHHKVISFLQALPKRLDKAMVNGNEEFLKKVQKSARRMAPRDTGALANTILIEPTKTKGRTKQFKLLVDAPYAYFQEETCRCPLCLLPGRGVYSPCNSFRYGL